MFFEEFAPKRSCIMEGAILGYLLGKSKNRPVIIMNEPVLDGISKPFLQAHPDPTKKGIPDGTSVKDPGAALSLTRSRQPEGIRSPRR